ENGDGRIGRATLVLQVIADDDAAALLSDQNHLRRVSALAQRRYRLGELPRLLGDGGAPGLRPVVDPGRQRIVEIDGIKQRRRIAVRLEPPDRRHPLRRRIAVAVDEDDRQRLLRQACGGRRRQGGEKQGGKIESPELHASSRSAATIFATAASPSSG